jgi:beta-phosphoglucomutase-like phosphatase (HAD superfamily)
VLAGAGLLSSIETYVSSDEVTAGKPAPDVYVETARRLALAPQDCVVVEDSTNGIKAARAAGTLVVAIPNRLFPPDPATLKTADAVLAKIKNLTPEWLSQKGSFVSI